MLIDIHSHLFHSYFSEDIEQVIENAIRNNVRVIVVSGLDRESNKKSLLLSQRFEILKTSMGIYPSNAYNKENDIDNDIAIDNDIEFIEKNKKKIVYLGEVGLDYKEQIEISKQKKLFSKMIELAERINKPVLIHSRKAEQDCIEMLESSKLKKIIMHCFSGKNFLVRKVIDNGWFLTAPTCIVHSTQFQENIKIAPITQIFCETDAPYLSPFRGKRNEPAFIIESYKKVAEIKNMEMNEVINNIWMNWQRLL